MPLSALELNRVADYVVANELTCYVSTATSGADGTENRIGTASSTLAVADWSDAASGDVTYNADTDFGVLTVDNDQTVRFYQLFRGNDFVWEGAVNPVRPVTAGGTFSIDSGEIQLNSDTA